MVIRTPAEGEGIEPLGVTQPGFQDQFVTVTPPSMTLRSPRSTTLKDSRILVLAGEISVSQRTQTPLWSLNLKLETVGFEPTTFLSVTLFNLPRGKSNNAVHRLLYL